LSYRVGSRNYTNAGTRRESELRRRRFVEVIEHAQKTPLAVVAPHRLLEPRHIGGIEIAEDPPLREAASKQWSWS
jgi:hypothetical protein